MKIITCITDTEHLGYKYVLKSSCDFFGLELITLIAEDKEWETHRNKDLELAKALTHIPDSELVLFTDGYDAMFIGNEKQIIEKYDKARKGNELLISAEKSCYPDTLLATQFPNTASEFKYLNSGGIMGTAKTIKIALDELDKIKQDLRKETDLFVHSNQYLWTLYFLTNKDTISLDTDCNLFQTLTPKMNSVRHLREMEEDINERKEYAQKEFDSLNSDFELNNVFEFRNKLTGSQPLHLHFNSPLSKFGMFQEPYLSWIEYLNTDFRKSS